MMLHLPTPVSMIAILIPSPLIPSECTWSTPPIFRADETSKSGPVVATGKVPFQETAFALALLSEVKLLFAGANGRGALTM